MDRWVGRVALVTGASAGIGLALAEALAKHGMKVVGCARNITKIQELSERLASEKCKGVVRAIRCDLTKEEDILGMFTAIQKEFGGVDACINNAGLGFAASLVDGDTADFRLMMEVNVLGLTLCTREAIRSMRQRGVDDGHIINVGSIAGHMVTDARAGFYSATKFAVRALTEGLRMELRELKSKIRVTCVSPGLVETEFAIRAIGEEAGKEMYRQRPIIQAGDIVESIIFQLSVPPSVQVTDMIVLPVG